MSLRIPPPAFVIFIMIAFPTKLIFVDFTHSSVSSNLNAMAAMVWEDLLLAFKTFKNYTPTKAKNANVIICESNFLLFLYSISIVSFIVVV